MIEYGILRGEAARKNPPRRPARSDGVIGSIRRDLGRFREKDESGTIAFTYQGGKASLMKESEPRPLPEFKPSGTCVDALEYLKGFLAILEQFKLNGTTRIIVESGRISGIYARFNMPVPDGAAKAASLLLAGLPPPRPARVLGRETRMEELHVLDAGTVKVESVGATRGAKREFDRMRLGKIRQPSLSRGSPPILPGSAVFKDDEG